MSAMNEHVVQAGEKTGAVLVLYATGRTVMMEPVRYQEFQQWKTSAPPAGIGWGQKGEEVPARIAWVDEAVLPDRD